MKRAVVLFVAVALLAGPATVAQFAQKAPRLVRLEGWLVDEWCAKKKADVSELDCAGKHVEEGAALVFVADDKEVYALADEDLDMAMDKAGEKVAVLGTVDPDNGVLNIGSFMRPKGVKKAKAKPETEPEAEPEGS